MGIFLDLLEPVKTEKKGGIFSDLVAEIQQPEKITVSAPKIGPPLTAEAYARPFFEQTPLMEIPMQVRGLPDVLSSQTDNLRPDGTKKGKGFLGEQKLPGGGVASEYSIGVKLESMGGKETDIPTLVPTLTPKERDLMINDIIPNKKQVPESIIQKAVDHANKRIKEGKSIFAEEQGFFGKTGKAWQRGGEFINVDFLWHKVAMGELDEATALKAEKQFEEISKRDPIAGRNWLENLWLQTAQMARPMAEGTIKGAKYGAGAAIAAGLAGQAGPQIAAPEEIVTVPSAYTIGQVAGSMKYWSEQGSGSIYKQARKQGLSPKAAGYAAAAGGPLYAFIEYSQVDKIIPGIGKIKGKLLNKALQIGINAAHEVVEEGAQKIVTDGSVAIGELVEGKINATDIPEKVKQIGKNALIEMKEAAGPMALLQLPGAVTAVTETIVEPGRKTPYEPELAKPAKIPPISEAIQRPTGLPPIPVSVEKQPQVLKEAKITAEIEPTGIAQEARTGIPAGETVAEGAVPAPAGKPKPVVEPAAAQGEPIVVNYRDDISGEVRQAPTRAAVEDIELLEESRYLQEEWNKKRTTKRRKSEILERSKEIDTELQKRGYTYQYIKDHAAGIAPTPMPIRPIEPAAALPTPEVLYHGSTEAGKIYPRPATPVEHLANVKEEGKPGLSIEKTDYSEQFQDVYEDTRVVVYRDETGNVIGTISFNIKEDGTLEDRFFEDTGESRNQIEIFVKPEYRRKGVATKMWQYAKEQGYNFSKIKGQLYTEEGEAFAKSLIPKPAIEPAAALPEAAALQEGVTKPKKKLSAKEEFKVGDVINTKGQSNMADPITIREIKGNTLKFTDAEGTEYYGMARAQVRRLVEDGSWERIATAEALAGKPTPEAAVKPAEKQPWEMTREKYIQNKMDIMTAKILSGILPEKALPVFATKETTHFAQVRKAVEQGKSVPREVLEEYKGETWADEALAKVVKPAEAISKEEWKTGSERDFAFDENSTENEGRFRLYPPEQIKPNTYISQTSIKSRGIEHTPGVRFLLATTKDGKRVIQTVRFDKSKFTQEQAAEWWEKNKSKFEFYKTEAKPAEAVEKPSEREEKPTEARKAEELPISVNASDVDYKRAERAYANVSHTPEKRAEHTQAEYVAHMQSVYDELMKYAQSDTQKAILKDELQRYKEGYLLKLNAYLDASSRTASSFIVGPAKFPVRQMEKRHAVVEKRLNELLEWQKKAQASIKNKLREARTPEEKQTAIEMNLKRDFDRNIEVIKQIDSGKGNYAAFNRTAFTNSIAGKIRTLIKNRDIEIAEVALNYIKKMQESMTKPILSERHGIWQELEVAKTITPPAAKTGRETIKRYEGAEVVNDFDADRIQILLDDKPDEILRNALKKEGWHWSPSNKAWQRKITVSAKESAKRIIGDNFKEEIESTEEVEKAISEEVVPEEAKSVPKPEEKKPVPIEAEAPITKEEKDALREKGYSLPEILKMTPAEARGRIAGTFKADPTEEGEAKGEPGFAGVAGRPGGKVKKPWLTRERARSPNEKIAEYFDQTKRKPYTKKVSGIIEKLRVGLAERFILTHHIQRTPENAIFIDMIRTMPEERRFARERAIREIIALLDNDGTVQALDSAGLDLLTYKVFIQDMLSEAKINRSVPRDFSIEELEAEDARLDGLINEVPSVKKAYETRQELWKRVSQDLLERGVLDEESAKNQAYVRHFVLDLAEKNRPTGFRKKKLSQPYRPYSKHRKGSHRDYATDFLEVEVKALADIYADNAIEDVHNKIADLADKRREFTERAKVVNFEKLVGGKENVEKIEDLRQNLKDTAKSRDTETLEQRKAWIEELTALDPTYPFRQRIAMHMSKFKKLTYEADEEFDLDESSSLFAELAKAAREEAQEPRGLAARGVFKAMAEREQLIRQTLGREYITAEKLARTEGYREHIYKRPNVFYRAATLNEAQIAAFVENSAEEAGAMLNIPVDMIRSALVLGHRKNWILPEDLADQLDDLPVNRHTNYIIKSFTAPFIQFWKRWILRVNPLRYNYRNLIGDSERFIASGQEHSLLKIHKAVKSLILKNDRFYPLLKQYGAAGSSLWHEMNDVSKIKEFEKFKDISSIKTFSRTVKNVFKAPLRFVSWAGSGIQKLTQLREDILRAAVFIDNLEKLEAGEPVRHWAGNIADINEIAKTDKVRAAAKISRETLGDYGAFTPFENEKLRQGMVPFYSWMKINTLFWPRAIVNAAKESTAGAGIARGTTVVGLNIAKWLIRVLWIYGAAYLWNHRDEEAEQKEASLPFWLRAMPHLNVGDRTLWSQTALSDFVEWADMESLAGIKWRMDAGFLSPKEAAMEAARVIAEAPVNKVYQALNPFMKAPITAISGIETYPSVFKPHYVASPASIKSLERAVLDIMGGDAKKFYQAAKGDRKFEDTLYAYFAGWFMRPTDPDTLIEEIQRTKEWTTLKSKSKTTGRLPGGAKKGREAEWQEGKIRQTALTGAE